MSESTAGSRRRSRASSGARKPLRRRKRPGRASSRPSRPTCAPRARRAGAEAPRRRRSRRSRPFAPRGAGQGAGAPKYGYESLLSDVSRAYCGYDEAYFHDRPRELASREKAGQAARAAADAREVVASREAALRSSKDAARAADAALRQLRKPAKTTKETKKDLWLAAPASPTPSRDRQEDRRAAPARRGRPRAGPGVEEGARGAPRGSSGRPRGRPGCG